MWPVPLTPSVCLEPSRGVVSQAQGPLGLPVPLSSVISFLAGVKEEKLRSIHVA